MKHIGQKKTRKKTNDKKFFKGVLEKKLREGKKIKEAERSIKKREKENVRC